MTPATRIAIAFALLLVAIQGAQLLHAARRRASEDGTALIAIVRATGSSELVLSSSARWLRRPHESEPSAALTEGPGSFDVDPAGGVLSPPRTLWRRTIDGTWIVRAAHAGAP